MPVVDELPHVPFLDGVAGFRWRLGLRPLDLADWFEDGLDAQGWIDEKQRILGEHHDTAFAALPGIEPEAVEVADAIVDHLRRVGHSGSGVDRPPFREDLHPLDAAARLVAEDLVLMVERDGRLVCGGGSVCFPNRWDLGSKLGLTLREVHAPVPLLNEQLGDPVDRFLERLTPERGHWRLGWGIVDVADGYLPLDGTAPSRPPDPSPRDLFVRVERETLRRFPRTGCVLFTIRTSVAPLPAVAEDPSRRRRLADALEAMPAPVRHYKDLSGSADEIVGYLWGECGDPSQG